MGETMTFHESKHGKWMKMDEHGPFNAIEIDDFPSVNGPFF